MSRRLRVTVIDFVERGPTRDLFKRTMSPSFANIMPQAIACWCEELGHQVRYLCYTGGEDLAGAAEDSDVLIVGAYTVAAYAAYAVSAIYRAKGAITALGGPHARCYPEDAALHFDYVLGLTDKPQIAELLGEAAPHRPIGRQLGALAQPRTLPNLRQRWKFAEANLAKAGPIKIVPMIGSLGCPYTCSFCIDAAIPYQPLDFAELQEDLRFVATKIRNPLVGWHDPNFGVRFDQYMDAVEGAAAPGTMRHIAEMSLSLLTDSNLERLQRNGFVAMLPGVESWYDYGNKSRATRASGADKVTQVADHLNRISAHIPFVQANFILGLDCDQGDEPFELTKRFMDLTPGVYPAFSLFTGYGRASPLNLELQQAGRINAMAFHFLDGNHGMNIRPLHYSWPDFYDRVSDVTRHALGRQGIWRRLKANGANMIGAFNLFRGLTTGRPKYQATMAQRLRTDIGIRAYFEGESAILPDFFRARIRKDLGPLYEALPDKTFEHDPYAYLNAVRRDEPRPVMPREEAIPEVQAAQ